MPYLGEGGRVLLTGDPALREIFEAALEKFRVGEQKHGPFDPATDPRDLLVEAEREILDAINYLAMHLLKLRTIGQGRCCGGSCKRSETGEGGNHWLRGDRASWGILVRRAGQWRERRMSSTALERLGMVQSLFPPGFSVLAEMLRHGVKAIRLTDGGFLRYSAAYDPEEQAIELNPNLDRERLARVISERNGVRLEPGEVILWAFLHELGHHKRRRARSGVLNAALNPSGENQLEDWLAEQYARKRFLAWRRTRQRTDKESP